jgi:hypothetical protein
MGPIHLLHKISNLQDADHDGHPAASFQSSGALRVVALVCNLQAPHDPSLMMTLTRYAVGPPPQHNCARPKRGFRPFGMS